MIGHPEGELVHPGQPGEVVHVRFQEGHGTPEMLSLAGFAQEFDLLLVHFGQGLEALEGGGHLVGQRLGGLAFGGQPQMG
jgi:hypothetical protein